jgi:peroxiredoxin
MKRIKVGQAAPQFEARSLDGKQIKLSDHKGKYVLLDFWATWCGPCVAETPHLKEAHAAFGNDPRFVMIGLSLDPKEDAPRDYARKNDLGWTQAFLGEWSKTAVPKAYGITGIPSMWLIGPDGTVIAKDLRGAQVKATLERELARK